MSIAVPTAVADEMSDEPVVDGEEETMEGEEFEDDEEDLTGMDVNGETIFFGIPEDDDEFHSMHIPQELKCDACKILAKQVFTILTTLISALYILQMYSFDLLYK